MITAQNIEQLKNFRRRSMQINEKIFKGDIIPRLQKNMYPVVGRTLSKTYFYRQEGEGSEYERINVVSKVFYLIAAIYFTDRKRGEILIQFVESFFAWLRAASSDKTAEAADFWDITEEQTGLMAKRQKAFATGDKQTARELSQSIAARERQMPMMLKSAVLKKRRAVKKPISKVKKKLCAKKQPISMIL